MQKLKLIGAFMVVLGSFSQTFAGEFIRCKVNGIEVTVEGIKVSVAGKEVKSSAEPKGTGKVYLFAMDGKAISLGVPAIPEGFSGAIGVTLTVGERPFGNNSKEIICNGRSGSPDIRF